MQELFTLFVVFIFFMLPVAIIALAILAGYWSRQRVAAAWRSFAAGTGLAFHPGGFFQRPVVNGAYRGFAVYLHTYVQGSGKNQTTYTSMTLTLPFPNRSHLRVYREGFFNKIGKALGFQDVELGDRAFDETFIVKSDTPELVPAILAQDVRAYLLGGSDYVNITLSGGTVRYARVGVETDNARLRYILDSLALVAARVVEVETRGFGAPPPRQPPRPQGEFVPVTSCTNCGADLQIEPQMARGAVTCSYCGVTTKVRMRFLR